MPDNINEAVDSRIDSKLADYDGGLSEQQTIELIDEHAPDDGSGDGLTDNERERLRALLDRIDGSLDTIDDELGLSMTIGPEVPDDVYAHTTPGLG